jgi:cysteinyl-tRNA synthetase
MAEAELGAEFDVHGGGIDLLFPHHENELAQSRGSGRGFARLWMHAGMLEAGDGSKMSKSVGNIEKLADALDRMPAWQLVLFFLSGSYRSPLAWSEQGLNDAHVVGTRITETLRRSQRYMATVQTRGAGDDTFADSTREWEGIHEALRDDFNTPLALSELNGLLYDLNTAVDEHATPQLVRNLRKAILEFLDVFGLRALEPAEVDVTAEAQALIEQRDAARAKKDFDESDRIRAELEALGYVVRDTAGGTEVIEAEAAVEDEGEQVAAGDVVDG